MPPLDDGCGSVENVTVSVKVPVGTTLLISMLDSDVIEVESVGPLVGNVVTEKLEV